MICFGNNISFLWEQNNKLWEQDIILREENISHRRIVLLSLLFCYIAMNFNL